ncbi:uncharacterized protein LOC143145884 isoform X3 [Ptiloglossa arizonensis]|uniref:uncharacterized protein LOC143145884 isoform X3 n=1 Tax=Ptiloglossa arizonensis TaxID=3350558 RepID=UPI003F9F636F
MKVGRESVRVAVATKTSRSGQRDEGKGRERPVWKKEGKRTHENALVFRERHAVSDRSTTVTLARSGKGKISRRANLDPIGEENRARGVP